MRLIGTTIVALTLVVVAPLGAAGESRTSAVDEPIAGLDAAFEQYRAAGLEPPTVAIVRSEDGCKGNLGLHRYADEQSEVILCSDDPNVLKHELAHAWIAQNTSEKQRSEYIELRGFDTWGDRDVDWHERGTEDAAFVLQSVLRTEHIPPKSPEWASRVAAFEILVRNHG